MLKSLRKLLSIKRKKALVLEGGGMRGIFTTGVLQSFTDHHYFPWKLLTGSSAGALTGAAYAAGQIHIARDAFFTELLSGDFINISNIMRNEKHIINLDWMVDTILKGVEPVNIKQLKSSCKLIITATHCSNYRPPETIYLDSKNDDIFTSLKASAALPYLYRGFVEYKNYNFLDGGLMDPIPYKKALELGYKEDEILIITSRPKGYRKEVESFWVKLLYESYYKDPKYHFLVKAMDNRFVKYNKMLDKLEKSSIDIIYPPKDFPVNRLTQDEKKILEGFEQGVSAARDYLTSINYL